MSIKSTTIAARAELLTDRLRRLAVRSHIEEQYDEVLIPRETLRIASADARKLRPLHAKDTDGNLAALP
jgi:hypothetical protein